MSDEPVIRVTVEIRDLGDRWDAHAYGGPVGDPLDLRIERPTEAAVQEAFMAHWNFAAGTSWTPEEFQFIRHEE